MNAIRQLRIEELRKEIETGAPRKGMVEWFSKQWKVSAKTVMRLIKTTQEEIEKELAERREMIEKMRAEEVMRVAKEALISELEADAALCKIISGTTRVETPFNTSGGVTTVATPPAPSDILKAVELYYKRFGSFAADKKEETPEEERVTGFRIADEPIDSDLLPK